ncbi:GT4 family glycosyltransferase PelF [Corynebacterium renale]|uniref:GT4 family glycosyltransferase PelF n=1 Tax=Corynebacterium renale TaxID=1724 RepID=UPI00069D41D5|nr:GT4 family glycosyltransferase PelF [Corynebacterium renale]
MNSSASGGGPVVRVPGDCFELPAVDVALVMESTYPFLKGGLSGVVHDLIVAHPDIRFGIIFTTWDSSAELSPQYPVPGNVAWVDVRYLAFTEHREAFTAAVQAGTDSHAERQAGLLIDALTSLHRHHDTQAWWDLYDRASSLWPALRSRTFMDAAVAHCGDVPLGSLFWTSRDFFSLLFALLERPYPEATVYHAHTTGYAGLIAAVASRQHPGSKYVQSEHNLYARDAVNTVLGRRSDHTVTLDTVAQVSDPVKRAWVWWYTRLAQITYPEADVLTYLYPSAITEAAALGGVPAKSILIPNGVDKARFTAPVRQRGEGPLRVACVARVVPIKAQLDLIDAIAYARAQGADLRVDLLGPLSHDPDYVHSCRHKVAALGLQGVVRFRGTVDTAAALPDYDLTVLASHNEGQPLAVMESLVAGVPVVATDVGGVRDLIYNGHQKPAGAVVPVGDVRALGNMLCQVSVDKQLLDSWQKAAAARGAAIPDAAEAMAEYGHLYEECGVVRARERAHA